MEQIRVFEGGLNTDDSLETMPPTDYPYLLNGIKAKSADGQRGTIENIIGATQLTGPGNLDANSTCIGAVRDQRNHAWYVFFHNTNPAKHCIVRVGSEPEIALLTRTAPAPNIVQVIAWSGLAFDLNFLVTGGCVADGVLYWTDNKNGPRCMNVLQYLTSVPVSEEEIALLKRGGIFPPTFVKGNATVDLNLTGKFGFQFAYQYEYADNQFSVLSPYSELCAKNTRAETFNKVRVSMKTPTPHVGIPLMTEAIPQLIIKIRFAARIGNNGAFFYIGDLPVVPWVAGAVYKIDDVVRSGNAVWQAKVNNPSSTAPVEGAEWTGTTISIDFFNNTNGAVVPSIYYSPYHLVPRKAKCLELIKNRLWFGNFLEGYNTPKDAGLTVTQVSQAIYTTTSPVIASKDIYVIQRTDYSWVIIPLPPPPQSFWNATGSAYVNDSSQAYNGGTTTLVMLVDPAVNDTSAGTVRTVTGTRVKWVAGNNRYESMGPWSTVGQTLIPDGNSGPTTRQVYGYVPMPGQTAQNYLVALTGSSLAPYEGAKTFPSGSSYRVGYILKDEHGRDLGGVITSNALAINTPKSYFNIINAVWTLPSANPLPGGFIPPEAKSYSIVMSRNLTKSYWFEYSAADHRYFKIDPVTGVETTFGTFSPNNDGIRVDVTPISKASMGYEFIEGDRIILYRGGTPDLPIKSFDGRYIRCPNIDVGGVTDPALAPVYFEIYRPVTVPSEILYYEIGQTFPIMNEGTGPFFPVSSGTIFGDSVNTVRDRYVLVGGVYVTDTPPNDKALFKAMSTDPVGAWDTDAGKPYVITTIGEVQKSNYFRFSATIINDTNVNGLCEHYVGDEGNTPVENGPINKLKSTSRQSSEGNVLLAICRNETSSIYVDEQRMNLDTSTSFMIQSTDVIGQVQTLKSNALGTIHPESVYDFNGNVFWWDAIHQKMVRYATNGLYAISDVKMIDHFEDTAFVNNLSRVVMGYDPFYRVFFTTHKGGVAGRKTISWSEELKRWISFHSFEPDFYIDIDNVMYSIKTGFFHSHTNDTAFNYYYGNVFNTVLELNFNDVPDRPKYWSVVAMLLSKNFWTWSQGEQKIAPGILRFDVENDFGQSTDITGDRFDYDENFAYAAIPKDKNTAGVANPLLNGDDMFSHIAKGRLTIFGQSNDVYKRINFVKLGFELSKGHQL